MAHYHWPRTAQAAGGSAALASPAPANMKTRCRGPQRLRKCTSISNVLAMPLTSLIWRHVTLHARLHVTHWATHMTASTRSRPSRDKVRAHRERLRRRGLRPIQIWVPDVRAPSFKAKAHRQSLAVAKSPHAKVDQDFIDAVFDPNDFWDAE
jgi:hypothetical protein